MASLAEKHSSTIDESVASLISRASNSRGLDATAVRPRVVRALEKYLFSGKQKADRSEIRDFVDGIRPDDLCLVIACELSDEKAWQDLMSGFDSAVKSAARKI